MHGHLNVKFSCRVTTSLDASYSGFRFSLIFLVIPVSNIFSENYGLIVCISKTKNEMAG